VNKAKCGSLTYTLKKASTTNTDISPKLIFTAPTASSAGSIKYTFAADEAILTKTSSQSSAVYDYYIEIKMTDYTSITNDYLVNVAVTDCVTNIVSKPLMHGTTEVTTSAPLEYERNKPAETITFA